MDKSIPLRLSGPVVTCSCPLCTAQFCPALSRSAPSGPRCVWWPEVSGQAICLWLNSASWGTPGQLADFSYKGTEGKWQKLSSCVFKRRFPTLWWKGKHWGWATTRASDRRRSKHDSLHSYVASKICGVGIQSFSQPSVKSEPCSLIIWCDQADASKGVWCSEAVCYINPAPLRLLKGNSHVPWPPQWQVTSYSLSRFAKKKTPRCTLNSLTPPRNPRLYGDNPSCPLSQEENAQQAHLIRKSYSSPFPTASESRKQQSSRCAREASVPHAKRKKKCLFLTKHSCMPLSITGELQGRLETGYQADTQILTFGASSVTFQQHPSLSRLPKGFVNSVSWLTHQALKHGPPVESRSCCCLSKGVKELKLSSGCCNRFKPSMSQVGTSYRKICNILMPPV